MNFPRDCLVIRIDAYDGDPIGAYRVFRSIEEKRVKLPDGTSKLLIEPNPDKEPVMYAHRASSQNKLNIAEFFIQALNKGLVWTTKNQVHVSRKQIAWKTFLTTSYTELNDIPEPEQLMEQFKNFNCTDYKIGGYLFSDQTNFHLYQVVIDLVSMTPEKSKILDTISQQKGVYASCERGDYSKSLELFQQFETQLFDVLKCF